MASQRREGAKNKESPLGDSLQNKFHEESLVKDSSKMLESI